VISKRDNQFQQFHAAFSILTVYTLRLSNTLDDRPIAWALGTEANKDRSPAFEEPHESRIHSVTVT